MKLKKTLEVGKMYRYVGPWQLLCNVGNDGNIGERRIEFDKGETVVVLTNPKMMEWNSGFNVIPMRFVKVLLSTGELAWMFCSNVYMRYFEKMTVTHQNS